MPKIAESKLSSNFTVAVPRSVATALGLQPGGTLEWYIENNDVVVKKGM